ncbi:response regulator receiver domain [Flagellimonas sp.]|uniref:response regulator receiver domain n=1 Tax=Flagellimonas sp. TaxID=2058762 RepID=UPI003AB43827
MTTIPNTVSGYSEYAAKEFLQTAVFIDDRIYEPKEGKVSEPKVVAAPKVRKKAVKSAVQAEEAPANLDDGVVDDEEYSPHDIVNSFAKKQIICSLYQPRPKAKVSKASDIQQLCLASDIVIVDWDLYGDQGKKAKELVEGLIKQAVEDVPEQLRLILVYTQEANLFDIASQLYEKVSQSIGDEFTPQQEEDGLAFHTANSRVSILGKTGRPRPDEYKEHEVEEKDLADAAVKEFAKLASGLLHASVLLGLAKIKQNSRKILSKFPSTLDPAFLNHRAMSLPNEEAGNHIVPLLVSEIEAVLEDKLPDPLIHEKVIRDWCLNVWKPGTHVIELIGENKDSREFATDYCLMGKEMREKYKDVQIISQAITKNGEWNGDRKFLRVLSSYLLSEPASKSNHEFSRLMSSRTYYDEHAKELKLGTIVYQEEEVDEKTVGHYFICLQPVCDSVRLDKERKFIFIEIDEMRQDGKNKFSHPVFTSDDSLKELLTLPKSYNCFVAEFAPDHKLKVVLAKKVADGGSVFEDCLGRQFIWLDQLKEAHAQRVVERFARELSRVGLTESEWQRFLG